MINKFSVLCLCQGTFIVMREPGNMDLVSDALADEEVDIFKDENGDHPIFKRLKTFIRENVVDSDAILKDSKVPHICGVHSSCKMSTRTDKVLRKKLKSFTHVNSYRVFCQLNFNYVHVLKVRCCPLCLDYSGDDIIMVYEDRTRIIHPKVYKFVCQSSKLWLRIVI